MIFLQKIIKYSLIILGLAGIFAMIFISIPYFLNHTDTHFLFSKFSVQHILIWKIGFKIHVLTSVFALILGFIQFIHPIRIHFPKIHRTTGKLYIILVLLFSGPGGIIMGIYGNGGIIAQISFVISAILWMLTSFIAIMFIKKGLINRHLYYSSLSFGLCLSAISLRFYVLVLPFFFHLSSSTMYALVAWLSWIPNLILAHYYAKYQESKT